MHCHIVGPPRDCRWQLRQSLEADRPRSDSCSVALRCVTCCTAWAGVFYVSCNISCSLLRSFIVPTWSLFFHECLWMLLKFHTCLKRFLKPKLQEYIHCQACMRHARCNKWHMFAHATRKKTTPLRHIHFLQVSSTELLLATQMNATSSRSHCLFIIKMQSEGELEMNRVVHFSKTI